VKQVFEGPEGRSDSGTQESNGMEAENHATS
jgi:hypothetical protein